MPRPTDRQPGTCLWPCCHAERELSGGVRDSRHGRDHDLGSCLPSPGDPPDPRALLGRGSRRAWAMWIVSSLLIGVLALHRRDPVFVLLAAQQSYFRFADRVLRASRYAGLVCPTHARLARELAGSVSSTSEASLAEEEGQVRAAQLSRAPGALAEHLAYPSTRDVAFGPGRADFIIARESSMRSTPSLRRLHHIAFSTPSLADPRLLGLGGCLTALVVERVAEERLRRALAEIKQPAPDPDSWEQLDIVNKTQAPMSHRWPARSGEIVRNSSSTSCAWTVVSQKCEARPR